MDSPANPVPPPGECIAVPAFPSRRVAAGQCRFAPRPEEGRPPLARPSGRGVAVSQFNITGPLGRSRPLDQEFVVCHVWPTETRNNVPRFFLLPEASWQARTARGFGRPRREIDRRKVRGPATSYDRPGGG